MCIPVLLAALTLQAGVPEAPFTTAPQVAEPVRLAVSPVLDGTASKEEWDPFTGDTFFQWEPRKLHFGAVTGTGKTLVVSIDLRADGWLVGNDNLEVRVDPAGKITSRRLDATNPAGPKWVDFPDLTLASRAAIGQVTELSVVEPGIDLFPDAAGRRIAIRVDAMADPGNPDPFLPRVLAPVRLETQRAAAMPEALRWGLERTGRVVAAGNETRIRFTFGGDEKVQPTSMVMRSMGFATDETNQVTKPFPTFDRKGRAFVDYETRVRRDARSGFRILQGTVKTADGLEGVIQASYEIAPIVEVDLINKRIPAVEGVQRQRFSYYIRSNSPNRLDGVTEIRLPEGLKLVDGNSEPFLIYNPRGGIRKVFELELKPDLRGTFPVVFTFQIGAQRIEHVRYLTINPTARRR